MLSQLHVLCVSHRTASMEELARLLPDEREQQELQSLLTGDGRKVVVLVTCNRLQCVWFGDANGVAERFHNWLSIRAITRSVTATQPLVAHRQGALALQHLLRVAVGLESKLQGDAEILGQVRFAWHSARALGHTDALLDRLFERLINSTRRVRQVALFDEDERTTGRATAIALAERLEDPWSLQDVLVVGSGAAATSALHALHQYSPRSLRVVSRTDARAVAVAESRVDVQAVAWRDLDAAITAADIVVFALRAKRPIVTAETFRELRRDQTRRALWADLGMPPNVRIDAPHQSVELLTLDMVMSSSTLNLSAVSRAEAALAHECAYLTAYFGRTVQPNTRYRSAELR